MLMVNLINRTKSIDGQSGQQGLQTNKDNRGDKFQPGPSCKSRRSADAATSWSRRMQRTGKSAKNIVLLIRKYARIFNHSKISKDSTKSGQGPDKIELIQGQPRTTGTTRTTRTTRTTGTDRSTRPEGLTWMPGQNQVQVLVNRAQCNHNKQRQEGQQINLINRIKLNRPAPRYWSYTVPRRYWS